MYQSKAAVKSLGVMGPVVALLVIGLGLFGIDVSGDVAGLPERIAGVVNDVILIVAIVAGIIGRIRASKEITGLFKAK